MADAADVGDLSDREWRQMRRTMSKLEFDPVPETPPLLLRSLYADLPAGSQQPTDCGAPGAEVTAGRTLPMAMLRFGAAAAADELPSTSATLSLGAEPSGCRPPPIAGLSERMAAAHEAIRQSVETAVADLHARLTKERAMERLQLTASHATDVTMLQSKVDELKEQLVAQTETLASQRDLMDRVVAFTAKRQEREASARAYWQGDHSIAACFRGWQETASLTKSERRAEQQAERHHAKRLLLSVVRGWARVAQQDAAAARLEQVQAQHERRVVQMAQEYQLKVEQLQRELEEATREVADLKKCRLQLEEDLRQVFLRGVSSMNIEALQVFNSRRQDEPADPSDGADPQSAPPLNMAARETTNRLAGCSNADADAVSPESMAPPVPRSSDTLHSLDSNLQRLLHLSSKLSTSGAATARVEQPRVAVRQSPAPRHVDSASEPLPQSWPRPRSMSSTAAPTTLRSAEMVQQQHLAALAMQSKPVAPAPSAALAFPPPTLMAQPTLHGSRSQRPSAAKLQVEMELLRAEFAAAASKAKPRASTPMFSRWK